MKQWVAYSTRHTEKGESTNGSNSKELIEALDTIHIYWMGYEKWINIRNKIKITDINGNEKNGGLVKQINGNIIAEYIRILQENMKIAINDPTTLQEVMQYCYDNWGNGTSTLNDCKKIRILFQKTYKTLVDKKTLKGKEKQKRDNLLDKTKHITEQ